MTRIYQPNEEVPQVFLDFSRQLAKQKEITESEFLRLVRLAIELVDSKQTTSYGRSHMAYHIAGIWLSHKNIDGDSVLGEIGGQFGEWEIEGSFVITDKLGLRQWQELKAWVTEAEKKYPNDE